MTESTYTIPLKLSLYTNNTKLTMIQSQIASTKYFPAVEFDQAVSGVSV